MYTYCRHIAYRAILPAACSLLVLLLASSAVYGQRRFYMQAPASVNQGQSFELTIVLENIEGTVTPPKLDAFVVLANSSFKEIGIVNGSMTRVTKETYQLLAKTIGQHNLGTAQLVAKGTTYQSNALSIKVTALSAAQKQQAQQQQNASKAEAERRQQQSSTLNMDNLQQQVQKDVFMRLVLSKSSVYKGEMLTAYYRIYFRQEVADVQLLKNLSFDGFWSQEVQLPLNRQPVPEKVDGVMYNTVDIIQYNLYPQHAGSLSVSGAKLKAVVLAPVQVVQNFAGARIARQTIQQIPIQFNIPAASVLVKELPLQGKPDNFSGLVGKYTYTTNLSAAVAKTDEPITYSATIKGAGNLKFIEQEPLTFPDAFEAYDPKVIDKVQANANGYAGSKQYDYLLIPRQPGEYTIAPQAFSYFEPAEGKYYTVQPTEHIVKVTGMPSASKGNSGNAAPAEVAILNQDIRYIKTASTALSKQGNVLLGTVGYAAALASPLLIFIGLVAIKRRRQKLAADVVGTKRRNAIKLAKKRLAAAEQYLAKGDKTAFYNEVSRSIWGYLGDKLNIDMSGLSKDAVEERLLAKSVGSSTIGKMKALLSTCEMALYAPLGNSTEMKQHYDAALNLIADLEDEIR